MKPRELRALGIPPGAPLQLAIEWIREAAQRRVAPAAARDLLARVAAAAEGQAADPRLVKMAPAGEPAED